MKFPPFMFFVMFFYSCNLTPRGASENIKNSKKDNMFIAEFTPYSNNTFIQDEIISRFNECFLEQAFIRDNSELFKTKLIKIEGDYNLIINAEEIEVNHLIDSFSFYNKWENNISRKGAEILYAPIFDKELNLLDTIFYDVYKNRNFNRHGIIGELIFIRKK